MAVVPVLSAKVWNVLDYGVVGDGVTPERNAIQAVIDMAYEAGGGTVYFPSRPEGQYYRIEAPAGQQFYPLFMRDYVVLQGDGPESNSLLKNPTVSTKFGPTFVFIWGTGYPDRWAEARAWPVGDVAVHEKTITLQDPAEISNFAVGDKIRVSDPEYVVYSNGVKHEVYGQMFRIMAIDKVTARISLSHAFRQNITGAVIHKIEDCWDGPLHIDTGFATYRGGLKGLRLESYNRVSARGGAIDCVLSDLDVQGYSGVLYGNSWHECKFRNINERVRDAVEMSDCSVGNSIVGLTQTYYSNGAGTASTMFAGLQEYSSYNTFSDFIFTVGNEALTNGAIRIIEGTGNTFKNGMIYALDAPEGKGRMIRVGGIGSTFVDIDIICRRPGFYLSCSDGPYNEVKDIRIDDTFGSATTAKTEITGMGSTYKDIVQPYGKFNLTAASYDNVVRDCATPESISDLGTNNTITP